MSVIRLEPLVLGLILGLVTFHTLADDVKCRRCVDTRDIAKEAITSSRIKDGSVTLDKLSPEVLDLIRQMVESISSENPPVADPESRFIDNGETVTDLETGLMWEKKDSKDGIEDYSNFHDVDNRYVWGEALPSFAGFTDWRLPTLDELKTILFAPDPCTGRLYGVCIADPLFYPNSDQYYWTSSDWEINPDSAYAIFFYNGHIASSEKYGTYHVRLVR